MDYAPELLPLEEMDVLLRTVWQQYQEYLIPENSELSPHQIYFLLFLARRGTVTPSEVSQEFGITLGATTGFVDRLYKLGLISRDRSETDRRLVLIELTERGRNFLENLACTRRNRFGQIMKKMGPVDIAELNKSLGRINAALTELIKGE